MDKYKVRTKEDWVGKLSDAYISTLLSKDGGIQSGTLRVIAYGPGSAVVSQVYCPPGGHPRVVAVYDKIASGAKVVESEMWTTLDKVTE